MKARNFSVSGKTVLSPGKLNSMSRDGRLAKITPISQRSIRSSNSKFSLSLKSTDQTTISTSEIKQTSKESMTLLRKQIEKLFKITKELTIYNHSDILTETEILNQLNTLKNNFQTFYHDSVFYYKSVKAVEESFSTERIVPNSALKSSSLTFGTNWRNVNSLFIEIHKKGKKSMADYIGKKFKTIDHLVSKVDIGDVHGNHNDILKRSLDRIQESALSQSKHATLIFRSGDIKNFTKIMEDMLSDVRDLIKQFDNYCSDAYSMNPSFQVELTQYNSLFHSACEEILIGIRAFFSFDNDMQTIGTLVNEISDHIQQIIYIAELPPCPIHSYSQNVRLSLKSRSLEPRRASTSACFSESSLLIPENQSFQSVNSESILHTSPKAKTVQTRKIIRVTSNKEEVQKVEKFIGSMQRMFDIDDDNECEEDAIEKLDQLHDEIQEKLSNERQKFAAKEAENTFNEKQLHKKIKELESKITSLDDYTKVLEDQLKTIKNEKVEKKNRRALRRALSGKDNKFAKSVCNVSELAPSILGTMQDDISTNAADIPQDAVNKCPVCAKYEMMQQEMLRRLTDSIDDDIMDDENNEDEKNKETVSFEDKINNIVLKIDDLNDEIEEKDAKIASLIKEKNEAEGIIYKMQKACKVIQDYAIKTLANQGKTSTNNDALEKIQSLDSKTDFAEITFAAFEAVKKANEDIVHETTQHLQHKNQRELREIADALDICDEETVAAITKCVRKVKRELEESKAAVNERDHVLNKLDVWITDHIATIKAQDDDDKPKSIEEKFQDLMFQFDEEPNPLEKPYGELSKERRATRESLEKIVSRMAKLFVSVQATDLTKQIKDIRSMKTSQILQLNDDMVVSITNALGNSESVLAKMSAENNASKKEIISLCKRVIEFLQKPVSNKEMPRPDQSLYELTSLLTQLTLEVCDSGTEKFIPKDMVVKEVSPIQDVVSINVEDPKETIHSIVNTVADTSTIAKTADAVHAALNRAFKDFDFTKIPDVNNKKFTDARDLIFQVNAIIRKAQVENQTKIGVPIIDLLAKFISITSSLFSLVAMKSFNK